MVIPQKERAEIDTMYSEYLKMALSSLRANKFRSGLTMFGVIIGIASVVTMISLGEGTRREIRSQITKLGNNVIVIQPGKIEESEQFSVEKLRNTPKRTNGSLSDEDWRASEKIPNVASSTPIGEVAALASYKGRDYSASVVATTHTFAEILDNKVEFGKFFEITDNNKNYAIIGRDVAEELFQENVPIGRTVKLRDTEFIVQGIFEQQASNILTPFDINHAVVIPYEPAKKITGTVTITQLLIRTTTPEYVTTTRDAVAATLKTLHAEQEDFTILSEDQVADATSQVFSQLSLFITGVAFVSLLVGGIGIMNIMFATVSERTREIGIRKALGATNQQLLGQFITEAAMVSVVGGIIGVIISFMINGLLRATTSFQPIITTEVVGIVVAISVGIGVVSGILPAARAARKDPIESLRYNE
jgi:putative ABC transport system permease protein